MPDPETQGGGGTQGGTGSKTEPSRGLVRPTVGRPSGTEPRDLGRGLQARG